MHLPYNALKDNFVKFRTPDLSQFVLQHFLLKIGMKSNELDGVFLLAARFCGCVKVYPRFSIRRGKGQCHLVKKARKGFNVNSRW